MKRALTISLVALLGAALVAATLAWRQWHRPEPQLDRQWTAQVRVIAGDGVSGWIDGPADRARFSDPFGVAVAKDGTIFVAEGGDSDRIRAILPNGRVTTFAGAGPGFVDGPREVARFSTPSAIALGPGGDLYVADTGNNAIRRIAPDGAVTTLAGDGVAGHRDGAAAEARFNGPVGLAVDAGGRVVVADTYNDRIRAISPDGIVSTIAGSGLTGAMDGLAELAQFDTPCGVAIGPDGIITIADTGSGLLRLLDPDGNVATSALIFPEGFARPTSLAFADQLLYVTDGRGRIIEVDEHGATRLVAGSLPGFADGEAAEARFRAPAGLAAAPGRLVVADAGNALVRLVAAASRSDVRPPAPASVAPHFDADRFGLAPLLWPVSPREGPHEIAGTLGESRGGAGGERFHAGIDVREVDGTPVLAVRDGVVTSPVASDDFGSLNEWLRIGPLSYVHIRAGRNRHNEMIDAERFVPTYDAAGVLQQVRVKRGSRFTAGEVIGSVNRFNHVHLNVGWPGEEINPLQFDLLHFEDTVPPTIARGGIRLVDVTGQPMKRRVNGRVVVQGQARIVVDAWDQAEGNRPERRLGLYDLGYQILHRDGTPVAGFEEVRHTLQFDRLAYDANAARLAYAEGSGIPFYGGRRTRFLYVVTNTLKGGVATQGVWDTTTLEPGDYIVRIWAADIRGNAATSNRDLLVTVTDGM